MFANYAYREVVINQMLGFHTLNFTNYAVVCLDQQLADFMVSIGKPCIADLVGGDLASISQARLHVIDNLLGNGTSVLLTDADAVWIKNPMEFLKDADIVTQRGSFPPQVAKHLGATACTGFAYFAGNSAASSFFHEEVMGKFQGDDQTALNEALIDNGIHFDRKLEYEQSRQIDRGIVPAKVHRRELHVAFLDHYRFPRKCMADTIHADTVVAHCLTDKTGDSKISQMKKMSLYWLKDGWEQTPRNKDFEAFITSLAPVKFIYVHVPKVAGESLIQAASDGNVPTCTSGTGLGGLHLRAGWACSCKSPCSEEKTLAIREELFQNIHMGNTWQDPVWVALVRDPETWFYSAVGQFCAGMGRDTLPCKSDPVDLQTLLESGWFNPKGGPSVNYYFHGDNLQLQMLGNIREQPKHVICSIENRNTLLHMMSNMSLGSIELKANIQVNVAHWPPIEMFRQNIPWDQVKGHYTKDTEFYNMVKTAGCISSESIEPTIHEIMKNMRPLELDMLDAECW